MSARLCYLCGVNPESPLKSYGGRCRQCMNALRYSKGKTCPDCGQPASNKATRCHLCALRARALPRITSTCEVCGKVYQHRHQELGRFCSRDCHNKVLGKESGDIRKARARPPVWSTCKGCGVSYVVTLNRPGAKFCTMACYNTWNSGENNPKFLPDLVRAYPTTFTNTLRWSIRARDGYTCQLCGLYARREGKRLCVHHIDYDKHNCDPSNLISLCGPCHGKTNVKRDYWKALFRAKLTKLQVHLS